MLHVPRKHLIRSAVEIDFFSLIQQVQQLEIPHFTVNFHVKYFYGHKLFASLMKHEKQTLFSATSKVVENFMTPRKENKREFSLWNL